MPGMRSVAVHGVAASLALILSHTACLPSNGEAAKVEAVKAALDARLIELEAKGFSGVVYLGLGDETVYSRGVGYADCKNTQKMSRDHVFLIGSITKELLKLLAYKLAAEHYFSFDDNIGDYIPKLPIHLAGLTIKQIITHKAGLPDLIDKNGRVIRRYYIGYDYEPVSREALINRFSKTKLIYRPGKKEKYSNLGYQVLAVIFELATDKPLEELLQTHIFKPAHMSQTGYVMVDWSGSKFADGCRSNGKRWGNPHTDRMWMADGPSWNLRGAGGLFSTARDLSRFLSALKNQKLLSPQVQASYLKDRLLVSRKYGEPAMGPGGSNGIFDAFFYWLSESDYRLIVLTNREDHLGENYGKELIRMTTPVRDTRNRPQD